MEKNKNNNLILVIILLIILICVIGMIIKKVIDYNSNDNEITQTQEENIQLSINDPLVQDLYTYVNVNIGINSISYSNDYIDQQYILKNQSLNVNNFDNNQLFVYATNFIDVSSYKKSKLDEFKYSVSIPKSIYDTSIQKVFGKSGNYNTDIDISFHGREYIYELKYNNKNQMFEGTIESGLGYSGPGCMYRNLMNAYKNDNDIILKEKFFFLKDERNNSSQNVCIFDIYKNVCVLELEDNFMENFDEEYYFDKYASTITYTFKLGEDNEYHYYSSEIER